MNPATGGVLLYGSRRWDQEGFRSFLRLIRRKWRGWRLVIFLDRGSPHRAKGSMALLRGLGIQARWLPVACPELNPLEGLWRCAKGTVLANGPTVCLDDSLGKMMDYIYSLPPKERLKKAGVLSGNFWMQDVLRGGITT